jgi:hypothetical protein
MDDEIQLAPALLQFPECGIDGGHVRDIAGQHDCRARFRCQRIDALLQGIALIGKGQFGAMVGASLGNAPGDGTVVGDAHDQALLAGHDCLFVCHHSSVPVLRPYGMARRNSPRQAKNWSTAMIPQWRYLQAAGPPILTP